MAAPALAEIRCPSVAFACRFRVSKLNSAGQPLNGAENIGVTDSIVQITSNPTITEGDRVQLKNGCGTVCVDITPASTLTGADLTLGLCELDAELQALLVGGSLITSGGVTVGYSWPTDTDAAVPVCVEAWAQAVDGTAQDAFGGSSLWWHYVWPYTTWVPGSETLENGVTTIPFVGKGRKNLSIGTGPAGDWPAALTAARSVFLDTAIPASACGTTTLSGGAAS